MFTPCLRDCLKLDIGRVPSLGIEIILYRPHLLYIQAQYSRTADFQKFLIAPARKFCSFAFEDVWRADRERVLALNNRMLNDLVI